MTHCLSESTALGDDAGRCLGTGLIGLGVGFTCNGNSYEPLKDLFHGVYFLVGQPVTFVVEVLQVVF
jgi:hypothetical protein